MADEQDPLLAALNAEESGNTGGEASSSNAPEQAPVDPEREKALEDFKKKLIEHREWDSKLKQLRLSIRGLDKKFEKTEEVCI